jgi:hypothetical protein
MDWLTFVVEMVKALAWPVMAFAAVAMLRRPIAVLIPLARKVKFKELEMEFGEQVRETKEEAAAELPPSTIKALPPGAQDTLKELARVSPRSAITEAWREVEVAIQAAAQRFPIPVPDMTYRPPTTVQAIRDLARIGVVDPGKLGVYYGLRSLRNQAVHAPEFVVSTEAAMDYAQTARQLAEYFRSLGQGPGQPT